MTAFAGEAWGSFGRRIVEQWRRFNDRYFDGSLRPIPLVLTNAQPYGKRLAFCSGADGPGRTITLNMPKFGDHLVADNDTLLHEMIHQFLHERHEFAKHMGGPWRREIMRLHLEITGKPLWAGRSKVVRIDGKPTRINAPDADGRLSLSQKQIARWPHDLGIDLGYLGSVTPS